MPRQDPSRRSGLATLAIATATCVVTRCQGGGDAAVRGSSTMDVAMLSPALLGRRAQTDGRAGNGHGSDRPVVRPPGDLDELARATHGFRVAREDEANGSSLRAEASAMSTGRAAILTTTPRRHYRRCPKSRSRLCARRPESWLSGTSRCHRRGRVHSTRVMEFRGRSEAHHQGFVRIHRGHPGDGVLLTGFDDHECQAVIVCDLRQSSRFPREESRRSGPTIAR